MSKIVAGPLVITSPKSLTFADLIMGTTSLAQTVSLTNVGDEALAISSVSLTGTNADDFAKSADTCSGASVAPGGTCTVSVTFTPTATGARTAAISIASNAASSPHTVSLTGTGIVPNPLPTLTSLSPARVRAGSGSFTLTINGTGFVALSVVRWNGTNRTTTFVNSTQLQITVPAGDVSVETTVQITVISPPPGGGLSNSVDLVIAGQVDDEEFVRQQYLDVLVRDEDAGGLAGWVEQLGYGVRRAQLVETFMTSEEFRGGPRFVAQALVGMLGEDPSLGWFRYGLGTLRATAREQLIQGLLDSNQFQAKYGANLTNQQFVERLYQNILGREADGGGLSWWTGQLDTGALRRAQVALALFDSEEYRNLASTQNRVTATLLYYCLLRRQPDAGGLAAWRGALDQGMPLGQVIQEFLASAEYAGRTKLGYHETFVRQQYRDVLAREGEPEGVAGWTQQLRLGMSRVSLIKTFLNAPESAGKGKFLAGAYLGILGRGPDYGGFQGWLGALAAGWTHEQVVDVFLNSAEFQTKYGANLTNAQYVELLYRNILGRAADGGGLSWWTGQLDSGAMTRAQLALAFLDSEEYRSLTSTQNRLLVTLLYLDLLRRTPDDGGLSAWTNWLNQGNPFTRALEGFYASTEYKLRL